jgi:aminopeptidase-like protein
MPEAAAPEGNAGEEMHALARRLFPLCRSITGNGVRQTLAIVGEHVPLEIREVPSGRRVFDWTVPDEWNIRDAYVKDSSGRRVIDFRSSNLHVVNYSAPVNRTVDLEELRRHLHSLPQQPDWVPYRTSYYQKDWGFCISHNQLLGLKEDRYEVVIDSTLAPGHLTYAECVLQGDSADEVLLTTHVCHPSLANDNLSGIVVLTHLARHLRRLTRRRYTYRLLWMPGTIGSITWLSENRDRVGNIRHGLVVTCLGDGGGPTYKRSRRGSAEIDRVMEHVLKTSFDRPVIEDFSPYGYDERQFCSPGFDLPVGLLQRSKHGQFPQYHTSADDLGLIEPRHLAESLDALMEAVSVLEEDGCYLNTNPHCEPQLGRRGLYEAMGGANDKVSRQMAMLWVLNLCDGGHTLLDIAVRSGMPFRDIRQAARMLEAKGLLRPAGPPLL